MPAPVPFMKGAQALSTFYLGTTKRDILVKSVDVQAVGEKIEDGVCGEDRDRLDFEISHYAVTLSLHQSDVKIIEAMIEEQAVNDAGVQPLDKSFALGLRPRDGSKFAFQLTEGSVDDWKLAVAGKKERIMLDVPLRFRYLKKIPL